VKRLVVTLMLALAAALATAGPAAASGPAAPGKSVVTVDCGSAGTFDVTVPKSDKNNGAGQIVGEKGHGIATSVMFTVTDETTSTQLFSDTTLVGQGHAHPNQQTITCTFVPFPAMQASDFFADEGGLPPGVEPTDLISALGTVTIILKR
jgi:hypothetical protein